MALPARGGAIIAEGPGPRPPSRPGRRLDRDGRSRHLPGWTSVQHQGGALSPDEQKARTILDAARRTIAEKGYAGTTVSQVASRARVSRGLLHYYFESKEDMLAQVVRSNVEATVAMVDAMFSRADTVPELATNLVGGLRQVVEEHPDFFHVFFESWAIARQSRRVARELETLYRRFRGAIQAGLTEAARRGVIDRRTHASLEGLAAVLTGIIDGVGLQLVTEPELGRRRGVWDACRLAVERALR